MPSAVEMNRQAAPAIKAGTVSVATIDDKVRRICASPSLRLARIATSISPVSTPRNGRRHRGARRTAERQAHAWSRRWRHHPLAPCRWRRRAVQPYAPSQVEGIAEAPTSPSCTTAACPLPVDPTTNFTTGAVVAAPATLSGNPGV
jgi:hypothetical protein